MAKALETWRSFQWSSLLMASGAFAVLVAFSLYYAAPSKTVSREATVSDTAFVAGGKSHDPEFRIHLDLADGEKKTADSEAFYDELNVIGGHPHVLVRLRGGRPSAIVYDGDTYDTSLQSRTGGFIQAGVFGVIALFLLVAALTRRRSTQPR